MLRKSKINKRVLTGFTEVKNLFKTYVSFSLYLPADSLLIYSNTCIYFDIHVGGLAFRTDLSGDSSHIHSLLRS